VTVPPTPATNQCQALKPTKGARHFSPPKVGGTVRGFHPPPLTKISPHGILLTMYTKTLDDEVDWKIIDQLHAATLNFSSTSLELKKLFFVLVGIAVPALIKLAGNKLDLSLFITLYLLTVTFWFVDSFTYYYQEKTRIKMDTLFSNIKSRHTEKIVGSASRVDYTVEATRKRENRFFHAVFNTSHILYYILFVFTLVAHLLFKGGIIA
jgi:hypothetical protein